MPTMSHNEAQRKAWHEGKQKPHESKVRTVNRCRKKKLYNGAFTPTSIYCRKLPYVALKNPR